MNRNVSIIMLVAVMCIMMASPGTAQESASPFMINGYVFDSNQAKTHPDRRRL